MTVRAIVGWNGKDQKPMNEDKALQVYARLAVIDAAERL
jgi:hypothetical protein